ncbi:MAG: hypothetical protein EXR75_06255 [Myxococcales bacterium]|nr:hypothetical protein [Myxococcales bacterium]
MFPWRRAFSRTLLVLAVLLITFTSGSSVALAQPKSVASLTQKAQTFYDDQRYEESIQTLSAALLRPSIAKGEKIEVLRLLAFNYIVLGQNDEADGAVRSLLIVDQDFELPEAESPKFRDFFAKTKKKWTDDGKPGLVREDGGGAGNAAAKIKHTSPAQVEKGSIVKLFGEVDDTAAAVSKVKVFYRAGSSGKFKVARAEYAMRNFSAEIPALVVQPPLVEYYVEAIDENGIPLATRGDAESPLRIAVPEGGGVLTSPWFWVPVSAAVVATVVVIAVVVSRPSEALVTINVFE